jgi:MFS family permease
LVREPLLTRAFSLCFAACFAQALAFNLYLHLPGWLARLGADEVLIGLLGGVASAAALVARPPVGRALDLRGRRPVILGAAGANVGVLALYLTIDSLGPSIWIVRALHGVIEAALFAALFTYAADVIPESRRTEGIALFGVSGMLPVSLGPLLGDWILASGDYLQLFAVSVAFALAAFALSLPLREARHEIHPGQASRGFLGPALQADLAPIWLLGTAFATAITAPFLFLKLFVEETGIGSLGLFFSSYSAAAVSLRLGLGWLPDRAGPKRVLHPALATLAIGMLLLVGADGAGWLVVAGALCGLGHGMTFPILSGLVITRARRAERGAAMALYTAVFDVGPVFGGPLFGAITRGLGYDALFATAALIVIGGAVAFAAVDRGR